MGITDFKFIFFVDGKRYTGDASNITRDHADGAGNPILATWAYDDAGNRGVVNLSPDWRIIGLTMK